MKNRFASPEYKPLSDAALRKILAFDRERGFGPGGTMPNRNRFYLYLVQSGSDVQIRTVAVKAEARQTQPVVKEVARASADDPLIHVRDLGFMAISGYLVDWSHDFKNSPLMFTYGRYFEVSPYGLRCMWKINAPVVNPELLKRTRRFRWSAWTPACGHLLDYLKVYREHPEIELLSKCGLARFAVKVAIVRKLKRDRNFRHFFMQHADEIKAGGWTVDVILKAYGKRVPFLVAAKMLSARRDFHGRLPHSVCAVKSADYCDARRIRKEEYTHYLKDCLKAGLDLADTKVAFPKNFRERNRAAHDRAEDVRRRENAAQIATMNGRLAAIAETWSHLEQSRGAFCVVIPRSDDEFRSEGRSMGNCLEQYSSKVASGKVVVVFIREKRTPSKAFIAAAYNPLSGEVTQCYGVKNSKPPKPVADFVKRVFAGVKSMKVAA